jgi:hypothetical protein
MVSRTKVSKRRRKAKKTKSGQPRKRKLRAKGSTPKFAVHAGK